MKHYLRIYRAVLHLNFSMLTAYRWNFINSLISSISWSIFSIASIILATEHTPVIFGWNRDEILILTAVYSIVIGVFHIFFSPNFERLSLIIHRGELDTFLVKPIDAQFLLSILRVGYASITRVIIGIWFLLHLLIRLGVSVTIMDVIQFVIFIILSVLLLYSLWFIVATLIIWFTRLSNLIDLMYTLSNFSRFPTDMYRRQLASYIFLFLLPLVLIVSTPTKFLLQRAETYEVWGLLFISLLFFFISRKFWKFALRYYTSASS